jgi:hypothetical protein
MPEEVDPWRGRGADVLDAFRQIHLTTWAERAIFRLFASDPDGCWSDAEMAFAARVDLDQVRWAVQRFADAGIVEAVEEGCFRWRIELRYVFERVEPSADRSDPVCLMPVGEDATFRAEDVFGRTESFCRSAA